MPMTAWLDFGLRRLLLDAHDAVALHLGHAEALRVGHLLQQNARPALLPLKGLHRLANRCLR